MVVDLQYSGKHLKLGSKNIKPLLVSSHKPLPPMSPEMERQQLARAESNLSCIHQQDDHELSLPKPGISKSILFFCCAKAVQSQLPTAL